MADRKTVLRTNSWFDETLDFDEFKPVAIERNGPSFVASALEQLLLLIEQTLVDSLSKHSIDFAVNKIEDGSGLSCIANFFAGSLIHLIFDNLSERFYGL